MNDKFKPCGCLTDGYNWLKECDSHARWRAALKAERFDARCWRRAVEENMIRDGQDGVAIIESEVRAKE